MYYCILCPILDTVESNVIIEITSNLIKESQKYDLEASLGHTYCTWLSLEACMGDRPV